MKNELQQEPQNSDSNYSMPFGKVVTQTLEPIEDGELSDEYDSYQSITHWYNSLDSDILLNDYVIPFDEISPENWQAIKG